MKNKVNIRVRHLEVQDSFRAPKGKGVYTIHEIEQSGNRIRLTVSEESSPGHFERICFNLDVAIEWIA